MEVRYTSFASNRTQFVSVSFLLHYSTQKEKFAVKWCNFIIHNYLLFICFNLEWCTCISVHLKNSFSYAILYNFIYSYTFWVKKIHYWYLLKVKWYPAAAYDAFISQLIRYVWACSSYECFILRARRLSSKLLKQRYLVERLKSSVRKFYGQYGDLIQQYKVSHSRMLNDILTLDQQWLLNRIDFPPKGCDMPAEKAYPSGHLVPSPFWGLFMVWLLRLVLPTVHLIDNCTELDLHRINRGFHWAFATGVTCQQGVRVHQDTWFRPSFLGLACAPIVETRFLELTMSLIDFSPWISLVLSRFCILKCQERSICNFTRPWLYLPLSIYSNCWDWSG